MTPRSDDTERELANHRARIEIHEAQVRDGARTIAANEQKITDLRERVVVLEERTPRPTSWTGKGGLVAVILFGATLLVGWLKLPTREDQEKAIGALAAADAVLRQRLDELALAHTKTVEQLSAARAAVEGLQRELAAQRQDRRR